MMSWAIQKASSRRRCSEGVACDRQPNAEVQRQLIEPGCQAVYQRPGRPPRSRPARDADSWAVRELGTPPTSQSQIAADAMNLTQAWL